MNHTLPEVIIYSDGAASPNPGQGAFGVVLIREGVRTELSSGFRKTTNNRMEILGAIVGLRQLAGTKCAVTIYSDSRYMVDMFNGGYAAKWRQNSWTRNQGKESALNPDLWGELLNLAAEHDVKFVWVRSHADNQENIRCDELAVLARQGNDLPPDIGYERPVMPGVLKQMTLFE